MSLLPVQILPLKYTVAAESRPEYYRRFNNSILHFKDDLYLMTYRLFLATKPRGATKKPIDVAYHPWESEWASRFDQPVLVLMRYNPKTRKFVILEESLLKYYCAQAQDIENSIADARLMMFRGKVYAHGNGWGFEEDSFGVPKKQLKRSVWSCASGKNQCELAVEMLLSLQSGPGQNKNPTNVHQVIFPCLSSEFGYKTRDGDMIEKNWSFFEVDNQLYTEYSLSPHIVARLDMDTPRRSCNHPVECDDVYEEKNTIFQKISRLYKGCYFSPGGSPYRWSDDEFINVGHVKYRYEDNHLIPINTSRIRLHPSYVYLMFVYTFSTKPPFSIRRLSYSFIPNHKHNHYALVFAMGIAPVQHGQEFAISYGEGDSTSNMIVVSRRWLEERLVPVDEIQPTAYEFKWI